MSEEDTPTGDPSRFATFTFSLAGDDDRVRIEVRYRNVDLVIKWRDSERQDLLDLLKKEGAADWIAMKGHVESEVARQSKEIDTDLSNLFPEDLEEEEE